MVVHFFGYRCISQEENPRVWILLQLFECQPYSRLLTQFLGPDNAKFPLFQSAKIFNDLFSELWEDYTRWHIAVTYWRRYARTVVPKWVTDIDHYWALKRRQKRRRRRMNIHTSTDSTTSICTSECSSDTQRLFLNEFYGIKGGPVQS